MALSYLYGKKEATAMSWLYYLGIKTTSREGQLVWLCPKFKKSANQYLKILLNNIWFVWSVQKLKCKNDYGQTQAQPPTSTFYAKLH